MARSKKKTPAVVSSGITTVAIDKVKNGYVVRVERESPKGYKIEKFIASTDVEVKKIINKVIKGRK